MRFFSPRVLSVAVVIGLFVAIYIGSLVKGLEVESFTKGFKFDVEDKAAAIERELLVNIESLYAVKGLFDSSEDVTQTEFTQLARSFIHRHPSIQALEWLPKVDDVERRQFESQMSVQIPDYGITEKNARGEMVSAQRRHQYFPVAYLAPQKGNEAALGFDLASSPRRLASLELARDTGSMAASASIRLVQESADKKGFLIFMPVYKGAKENIEQRRHSLQGFVLGVFRIEDIFTSAIARTAAKGLQLKLVDITEQDELLFETLVDSMLTSSSVQHELELMTIGGRRWQLSGHSSLSYEQVHQGKTSYAVVFFSISLVLISGLYIYGVIRRKELIKQEVVQRTKELNSAKEKLEVLSQTDSLTGIANRRLFDDKLKEEWRRAQREGVPITLIMIDIDYFKAYNDMYGHQAGDCCLCKVANALKGTLRRPADVLARYGGEEFVLLLPNTKNAAVPAKRCRADIEALGLSHEGSEVAEVITVSVGGISLVPSEDMAPEDAVSLADAAMYKAKASGRNCVNLAKMPKINQETVS